MATRRAVVTGASGQDGTYLCELLLSQGYEVHAAVRSAGAAQRSALGQMLNDPATVDARLHLHIGDVRDAPWLEHLLEETKPHEVYNLAAQSNVAASFVEPEVVHEVNYVAVAKLVEAVFRIVPQARLFQASSSEMFGLTPPPQNESSSFLPQSPYALAKAGAHVLVREARESSGFFTVNGISFNHESPRRSLAFVTRKISHGVAAIVRGESQHIQLGNLDAIRDWGYAPEYVHAMWLSLQVDTPDDYVFASGRGHTVREFVDFACSAANLDWRECVIHDDALTRPHDVRATVGDPTKARETLGWSAQTTAEQLAALMVEADLARG